MSKLKFCFSRTVCFAWFEKGLCWNISDESPPCGWWLSGHRRVKYKSVKSTEEMVVTESVLHNLTVLLKFYMQKRCTQLSNLKAHEVGIDRGKTAIQKLVSS